MISEFKNQLSRKEILEGLLLYINRKLWYVIVLLMLVVWLFSYMGKNSFMHALSGSVIIAIMAEILLILVHRRLFSTDKIATYKLHDDFLEIVSSSGISSTWKYSQLRHVETKNVIVLLMPHVHFAIVGKRHLSAEQIRILQR